MSCGNEGVECLNEFLGLVDGLVYQGFGHHAGAGGADGAAVAGKGDVGYLVIVHLDLDGDGVAAGWVE